MMPPILTSYDTVVIDAQYFTKNEIAAVQAQGTAVYAYLNIGSVETFREGYDSLKQFTLSAYDNWPGRILDGCFPTLNGRRLSQRKQRR